MDKIEAVDFETLDRISRHCPQALTTYLSCVLHSRGEQQTTIDRQYVEDIFLISWTKFKNHLRALTAEMVIHHHVLGDSALVHIVDHDPEDSYE